MQNNRKIPVNIFEYSSEKKQRERFFDWEKPVYSKDDVRELNRLMKKFHNRRSTKYNNNSVNFINYNGPKSESLKVRSSITKKQRVIFKVTFGKTLKSHLMYLKRYMPQKDKKEVIDKPVLFGTSQNEYLENISANHFKCIISPENPNVDFALLTESFINNVEHLTGFKLYWQAAIHRNTEHPHVHLAINGKDKNNQNVYFPKGLLTKTMRTILSDLTTDMIGPRSHIEIEAARKNMISAARWTDLDKRLEELQDKLYTSLLTPELQYRLQYLSIIGLADMKSSQCRLSPEWKEVLMANGRYNTFLAEYTNSPIPMKLYEGGILRGKVDKVITFDKDEAWNDAVIINTGKQRIYVPFYQLHKENLLGKEVEISGGDGGLKRQLRDENIKLIYKRNFDLER